MNVEKNRQRTKEKKGRFGEKKLGERDEKDREGTGNENERMTQEKLALTFLLRDKCNLLSL